MVKIVKFKHKSKAKIVIIIVSIMVVVAIGVAIFFFVKIKNDSRTTDDNTSTATNSKVDSVKNDAAKALYSSNGSDLNSAYLIYDNAIESSSGDEKTSLYINKALLAVNNNDSDTAIKTAQEALGFASESQLHPLYFVIAAAYETKKDYLQSEEYYQKAYDSYVTDTGLSDTGTATFYSNKISEMKGLINE